MKKLLLSLINFYQAYLSFDRGLFQMFAPGGACRYQVSCSEYMKQVIIHRGVFPGLLAGLKRLVRCQPYV